jgi:hypothetical protein
MENSSNFLESNSHVAESGSHVAEFSSHVAECSSHLAESKQCSFSPEFKLCMIFDIEKCCPLVPHLPLPQKSAILNGFSWVS